jgi:hypothetical protein
MRKILLAATAFAFVGAGSALALDSDTITVTAEVPNWCIVDFTDPSVALPADGSVIASGFSYTCNYEGSTAVVTFDSGSNGVVGPGGTYAYNINWAAGSASGTSALPVNSAALATTALANVITSVDLDLVGDQSSMVAGSYTDILTVSIAP